MVCTTADHHILQSVVVVLGPTFKLDLLSTALVSDCFGSS
jgi:hypothetical protein